MRITAIVVAMLIGMLNVAFAEDNGTTEKPEPTLTGIEIFPLSDLRQGMKGTALTVIRGTNAESFDVEVLELIPDGGFDGGPMILARFTGPVVDFSDGIAGGYSGSPVYIDGKLVGAVSMAMPYTDTHIGGITPIGQMLKSLPDHEELDFSQSTVLPPTENSGIPIDESGTPISFVSDYETARKLNDEMRASGIDGYAAVPATTPVYFSGISPVVMAEYGSRLEELLGNRFQVMELPMGRAEDQGLFLREEGDIPGLFLHESSVAPPLEAGDACAVTFVEGDVELYGIGTVTYSDNDGRFLLFGHMMMGEGETQFPIGEAYITWVHGSIMRAFKQGVRLNTLGTVTKDHAAACGGSFAIEPDMIPVRFKINDTDTGASKTMRFNVVRHRDFTPLLITMAMSQAAAEMLDRQPGGTLKLSYDIRGEGLKEPMRRTNYFFDDSSVLTNSAFELMPIADLLANNIYREVKISKIEILAEITRNRINASIDDAEIIVDDAEEEENTGIIPIEEMKNLEEFAADMIEAAKAEVDEEEVGDASTPSLELRQWRSQHLSSGVAMPWINSRQRQALGAVWPQPAQRLQQNPEGGEESEMPVPPGMTETEYPIEEIPTYHPGETIRVKVRLQPFRADPVWREFSITVPADFPSGSTMLYIHGGGDLMSWNELGGKGRSLWGFGPIIDTREFDLDSIISQIVEAPLNNELLLTLARPYEYIEPGQSTNGGNNGDTPEEEEPEDHIDEIYQMEWVIYNSFYLPINILSEEEEAEMEEMLEEQAEAEDDDELDGENDSDYEYETVLPF